MTVPKIQTYPASATNAVWQKKKSFKDKAKAATKTGLGEKLKTAERLWAAIAWNSLDLKEFRAPETVSEARAYQQRAQLAFAQQGKVRVAVDNARDAARDVAKNVALSTVARNYATTIANALDDAYERLEEIKITEFEDAIEELEGPARQRAAEYRANLKEVSVTAHLNGKAKLIMEADKAVRGANDVVTIASPQWKVSTENRKLYLQAKCTIQAEHSDEAKFVNDMYLNEFTMSGTNAKFGARPK